MDAITSMAVQAVALSIFIAAASWGAVRASVVAIAASRYFELRAERYPETADLPRPRAYARAQLFFAAALAWPALVTFVAVRVTRDVPGLPWIAAAVVGCVAALVALAVSLRSPWAKLRSSLSAAARAPLDRRDELLTRGFDLDPQLKDPAEG